MMCAETWELGETQEGDERKKERVVHMSKWMCWVGWRETQGRAFVLYFLTLRLNCCTFFYRPFLLFLPNSHVSLISAFPSQSYHTLPSDLHLPFITFSRHFHTYTIELQHFFLSYFFIFFRFGHEVIRRETDRQGSTLTIYNNTRNSHLASV